jgi:predicted DNA-binding protein (UPF0251 family)
MARNDKKRGNSRLFSSTFYQDLGRFQRKYGLNDQDLVKAIHEKGYVSEIIPICIFQYNLSSLEAIVKYLRENCSLSFKQIGALIARSPYTISTSYRASKRKHSSRFKIRSSSYDIPISVIADRHYSVLECIVLFLRKELRYKEIAKLLNLDQRTIWTVYNRALKK